MGEQQILDFLRQNLKLEYGIQRNFHIFGCEGPPLRDSTTIRLMIGGEVISEIVME